MQEVTPAKTYRTHFSPFADLPFTNDISSMAIDYLYNFPIHKNSILSFAGTGDVRFSLKGTTYQNNSIVNLEDIGGGDDALLCKTNLTACCKPSATGSWFFPNATIVHSKSALWDIYRNRGKMVVRLNRIRGGEDGIYHCEIPDSVNVTQTIYIGVYTASTGE